MRDPKKPVDREESPTPATPDAKRPGGFGAFGDLYRARWAANHPNMRPRKSATPTDAATAAPEPVIKAPVTDNEKRLLRPWERS